MSEVSIARLTPTSQDKCCTGKRCRGKNMLRGKEKEGEGERRVEYRELWNDEKEVDR